MNQMRSSQIQAKMKIPLKIKNTYTTNLMISQAVYPKINRKLICPKYYDLIY